MTEPRKNTVDSLAERLEAMEEICARADVNYRLLRRVDDRLENLFFLQAAGLLLLLISIGKVLYILDGGEKK